MILKRPQNTMVMPSDVKPYMAKSMDLLVLKLIKVMRKPDKPVMQPITTSLKPSFLNLE